MLKVDIDTEWTDYPVCPSCGFSDQDWWDGLKGNKKDGDSWTAYCCDCDKEYTVVMCVDVSFLTYVEDAKGDKHGQ